MKSAIILVFYWFVSATSLAASVPYQLDFAYKTIEINGQHWQAMAVNDSIPAPTLYFTEGDVAQIQVTNHMDVDTSVHWHGLLLPNDQDGVPYVNQAPIKPGETHRFEFPLRQSGTYWYHSHTGLQEQRGVYGAIVIKPRIDRSPEADHEVAVVLSDWTNENPDEVLRTLKSGSDYYLIKKGSQQNLFGAIRHDGVGYLLKQSLRRMPGMDISDIAYDRFMVNGQQQITVPAAAGQLVKIRLVNAATSTYFSLQFAGGDMRIVAADGMDTEPLDSNGFLMAVAETYTLLVRVPASGRYELRASAQDGSGHGSIWIGQGDRVYAPDRPKPNLYQMQMLSAQGHATMGHHHTHAQPMPKDGGDHTPYRQLRALKPTTLPSANPVREIHLDLTGDMERYIWSINNERLSADNVIKIKRGETVRFILNNRTMMHHPMHLHGHFFRVLNGQGQYAPLKHTVDVPPMGRQVIEFAANDEKDWFFHCHVLYHARSGMARLVRYQDDPVDAELATIRHHLYKDAGFPYVSASLMSQMTDGIAVLSNTRNTLQVAWEVGWQDVQSTEYEIDITYERYFDRYLSGFAGVRLQNDLETGIAGVRYLLPFNFASEWRVDTDGEFRITLGNELTLVKALTLFADFEYDTRSDIEWVGGLHYRLGKNWGLVTQYHSEFGPGAGVRLIY